MTTNDKAKLVYFNRRETLTECDKIDDSEVFALRNTFEGSVKEKPPKGGR